MDRARPRDRGRRNVDAGDIGTTTGCEQRVSPVPQPASRRRPVGRPSSGRRTKVGYGLPMSHEAGVPGRAAGIPLWVRLLRHESVPPGPVSRAAAAARAPRPTGRGSVTSHEADLVVRAGLGLG